MTYCEPLTATHGQRTLDLPYGSPGAPQVLGEHALIGISPFNSYYSEENMAKLFQWARENFKSFHVCFPEMMSKYTLMALGLPEKAAIKKTRHHDNNLKNKALRALRRFYAPEEAERKLVSLRQLAQNERYQAVYRQGAELFEHNAAFRQDCLHAIRHVLSRRAPGPWEEPAMLLAGIFWQNCPYGSTHPMC